MGFVDSELDALEADMGNETEADGMPSYLQPDTETDYDNELNLPAAPVGAPHGRVQVKFLDLFLFISLENKCLKVMDGCLTRDFTI